MAIPALNCATSMWFGENEISNIKPHSKVNQNSFGLLNSQKNRFGIFYIKLPISVRAIAERLSRDLAGDPKHIYKHKYDRKAHLAGDPKRKG